jgi:DNA processing protein
VTDLAYVALALTPGIGRARLETLLATFDSPADVLRASQKDLEEVAGISCAAATAIKAASVAQADKLLERTEKLDGCVIVPSDRAYPRALKEIPDPPTLLFASGQLDLLQQPAVAIVGSRAHTRYGAEVCRHLAGGAARAGLTVVSGMARGIDALAHRAALDVGGNTVGVLGNGLGVVYPSANRELYQHVGRDGCLITEFPPGERPNAGSFPRRNRLISGMARVTLVVEAREKSGALITVDCALAQGRDVLAVPGPVTSPVSVGCNRLIQHGAKPALGLRDVLEEYGLNVDDAPASRLPTDLSEEELRVLGLLTEGEQHVDQISGSRGVAEALAVLTSLEIRGLVEQVPGKVFRRRETVE